MKPCIVCSIEFKADLNEENELQIAIYGSVIGLAHGGKTREELAKELGEGAQWASMHSLPPRMVN